MIKRIIERMQHHRTDTMERDRVQRIEELRRHKAELNRQTRITNRQIDDLMVQNLRNAGL